MLSSGEVKLWDTDWQLLGSTQLNADYVTYGAVAPQVPRAALVCGGGHSAVVSLQLTAAESGSVHNAAHH